MIENPATAHLTFLGDHDGTVVSVDPLVVRIPAANGPGVTPIPAGDVRPQWFDTSAPKPHVGDTVRLIRNIWAPDVWTLSTILQSAPPPPAPTRCPICGQMVAADHDYAACEVGSRRPLAEATKGSLG
jgi:hypothetical protein